MLVHRLIALCSLGFAVGACSAASSGPSTAGSTGGTTNGNGGAGSGAVAAAPGAGSTTSGTTGAGSSSSGVDNTGGTPILGGLGNIMMIDPNAADCVGIVNEGEQITVDLFIMFDQSLSMTCMVPSGGDRWDAVKNPLEAFLQLPAAAGINVGIQYFGLGGLMSSCTPADYQKPDVEIGPLPMNAQPLIDSLNRHMPVSNTPTPAAVVGAINHAIDWKNQHPGHSVVVVLVTDGEPNACGAVADVANAAGQGFMNTIPTYVIGVTSTGTTCTLDPNPPNQADLDSVAMAGGTGAALIVDVAMDPAQQFVDTMNKIRAKSVVPCQYALPPPPAGSMLDPSKVNVQFIPPGQTTPIVVNGVTMATCDPTSGGWYYDNPGAPTKINLCPSTCSAVTNMIGGRINVAVGCATKHPA
ncbi:MAG TPA: vWA domain-containing protein [Polyangiaceae bacterium]|jgi:hypothetical protein|nr:vWA domain-containing protein [Polyangiaceae bacterium]